MIHKAIRDLAKENNVEIIDCGKGHIQLKGKLTVNYYPESKRKTAYICGTTTGSSHTTFKKAILMANRAPAIKKKKERHKRKSNYRKYKIRLLEKNPFCHWCNMRLTIETATLEHIVPLVRGGLNNSNNYTLACETCNHDRADGMPELED